LLSLHQYKNPDLEISEDQKQWRPRRDSSPNNDSISTNDCKLIEDKSTDEEDVETPPQSAVPSS
jgi:hypothetical protein